MLQLIRAVKVGLEDNQSCLVGASVNYPLLTVEIKQQWSIAVLMEWCDFF